MYRFITVNLWLYEGKSTANSIKITLLIAFCIGKQCKISLILPIVNGLLPFAAGGRVWLEKFVQ